MKSVLSHPLIIIGCRVIMGAVFVGSGAIKIVQLEAFADSIANYKVVSEAVVPYLAMVLPWLEFFCGIGILLGIWYRGSSFLILTMMIVFTGAVFSAVVRGLDISCGCFTQDPSVGKVGWLKLAENAALIIVALVLFANSMNNWRFALQGNTQDKGNDHSL